MKHYKRLRALMMGCLVAVSLGSCDMFDFSSSASEYGLVSSVEETGERFNVKIHVNFKENFIFDRYDVYFYIDDDLKATIEHGDDPDYEFKLSKRSHKIKFQSVEYKKVYSTIDLDVTTNTNVTYSIKTHDDSIDLDETSKETYDVYSITYVLNGGTNSPDNPTTYTKYDEFELVDPTPGNSSQKFISWTDASGSEVTKIDKGTTGDLVLTANFETVQTYSITYVLNDGTNSPDNPTSYTKYDEITLLPANAPDEDHEFDHWSDSDGNVVNKIEKGTTGDLVLTANYSYKKYKIIYHFTSSQGKNPSSNPTAYSFDSPTISLSPLNMEWGYGFDGWYLESDYQTEVTEIASGSRGDINLYAKTHKIQSDYEYAYKQSGGGNYYLFDIEDNRYAFVYINGNTKDKMSGRTSGTLASGLKIYVDGEVYGTMRLSNSSSYERAILTDDLGYTTTFLRQDVDTVEKLYRS